MTIQFRPEITEVELRLQGRLGGTALDEVVDGYVLVMDGPATTDVTIVSRDMLSINGRRVALSPAASQPTFQPETTAEGKQ